MMYFIGECGMSDAGRGTLYGGRASMPRSLPLGLLRLRRDDGLPSAVHCITVQLSYRFRFYSGVFTDKIVLYLFTTDVKYLCELLCVCVVPWHGFTGKSLRVISKITVPNITSSNKFMKWNIHYDNVCLYFEYTIGIKMNVRLK